MYGDAYPEDAEPFGAAARSDLQRIAEVVGVGPGQVLLDLGCGAGGPGLLVAQRTGARLVGMDLSAVAMRQATERAANWGLRAQAAFLVGDVCASGLPSAGCDGAMSVDGLWMVPDKRAAVREIARLLRPAARFVCTTWAFAESPPDEPQVADYRPSLCKDGRTLAASGGCSRTGMMVGRVAPHPGEGDAVLRDVVMCTRSGHDAPGGRSPSPRQRMHRSADNRRPNADSGRECSVMPGGYQDTAGRQVAGILDSRTEGNQGRSHPPPHAQGEGYACYSHV